MAKKNGTRKVAAPVVAVPEYELEPEDSIPVNMMTPVSDEDLAGFQDTFIVESSGVFPQHLITEIILPKFAFVPGSELKVSAHQNIIIQTFNEFPIASNVLKALKEGLMMFQIKIYDQDEQYSTWNFLNPKIVAIDFGNIMGQQRTDYRTIQCEIDFSGLEIDGVAIKTK